ncbi:MAG: class I SAM-dependent methyltransferase [Chloroflexota bacterium]|nr:class I SAM-dependent methyltransferase [Chloroflexota bacterium]
MPLWGRAVESQKDKPRLLDATADKIIGQVDVDFLQAAANLDEKTKITWIKRSIICDQIVRNFLSHTPDGTVVNIGCGLDMTYSRIDSGNLRWYDLDLPDVIELRKKVLL